MTDNAAPLLLLTRPAPQAARFAEAVLARCPGVEWIGAPLLRIEPAGALPQMAPGDHLVFSSENGVAAYVEGGGATGRRAYCVGERTSAAASAAGLHALNARGAVADLEALILADAPKAPLWHLHGEHVSGTLAARLQAQGLAAREAVIYRQHAVALSPEGAAALAAPRRVIAPIFSPRTARLLAEAAPAPRNTVFPCISEAARAALPENWRAEAQVAARPDGDAMLDVVARQLCP